MGNTTTNKKDMLCPLGCPATRRFDRSEMEEHLSTLHGCDEDYSMSDDGTVDVGVDPDMMAACPLCAASLNIMDKSMLTHVFYQCNGRCPLLKETVKGLQDLGKVSAVEPGYTYRTVYRDSNRYSTYRGRLKNFYIHFLL